MTNKQNFIVFCVVYFIIVVIWLIVFFGHANAQTVDARITNNGYDCFNYEIKSYQMQRLQSMWIYSTWLRKMVIQYKINKLYPSYMNTQVLCLWFTNEPN